MLVLVTLIYSGLYKHIWDVVYCWLCTLLGKKMSLIPVSGSVSSHFIRNWSGLTTDICVFKLAARSSRSATKKNRRQMSLEVCSERNLFRVVVSSGLAAGKLKHKDSRVSLHLLVLKNVCF